MNNAATYEQVRNAVIGKLVDHTVDTPYEDLGEQLFGKRYNSSTIRKMFYGCKEIIDIIDREGRNSLSPADAVEFDERMAALRKEQQRFYDQRREYNKAVAKTGRSEHLEERLIQAADNLGKTVGRMEFAAPRFTGNASDAEAVVVFSDWHYGMVTNNIWNMYDTQICRDRVRQVVEQVVERIQLHGCRTAHVVVLGDLIHGAIHVSARVASEELVCDQLMEASEILAQSIDYISRYVEKLIIYTTYGNHARTVQNKKDNIHEDNMERIIPWWLRERLKGNNKVELSYGTDEEILYLDPCGHGICAAHGDLDAVKTSPRLLTTLFMKRYGKDIEYILLGDKHHRESFEELGVNAMICGSICGTDEYANGKRLYSLPEQTMLIVQPDIGVDAEYHLRCI